MPRLKKGTSEDVADALDLKKMSQNIDELMEQLEEKDLTRDEALWTAAVFFLSVFSATDDFANSELLSASARALLKEAVEVFEGLPDPDDEEEETDDDDDGETADTAPS